MDYKTDWIDEANRFNPFLHKRKSFEHEREVRAVVWRTPKELSAPDEEYWAIETMRAGASVAVDLGMLVENIFVSPESPQWYLDSVLAVVHRFGLRKPVRHSDLSKDPVF